MSCLTPYPRPNKQSGRGGGFQEGERGFAPFPFLAFLSTSPPAAGEGWGGGPAGSAIGVKPISSTVDTYAIIWGTDETVAVALGATELYRTPALVKRHGRVLLYSLHTN